MHAVSTEDPADIPAIIDQVRQTTIGSNEVFPSGDLAKKIGRKRPLRVKLGFDPTKPDLHIGHAVVLNGLRRFQQAGHQVVVIIGDFTARIGDPTGKESARPPLSPEEIDENAKTYLEQLSILIDLSAAEIRRNSEWLSRLTLEETIRLMSKATVAQMLARENFAKRYERGDAIGLHEFLYPLLQGYDSVVVDADVELGGSDQRFNLLVGRDLQGAYGKEPQVCITYPILEGTDGKEKMSKSQDNYIGLTMAPGEMYGRTMSIPDALLTGWYQRASGLPEAEVREILSNLESGQLHPRDAKMRLARAIVSLYHREQDALQAEEGFVKQFQKKELPDRIDEKRLGKAAGNICALLVEAGLAETTSEVRRAMKQNGVRVHGQDGARSLSDPNEIVTLPPEGMIVQGGKRRFAKLHPGA